MLPRGRGVRERRNLKFLPLKLLSRFDMLGSSETRQSLRLDLGGSKQLTKPVWLSSQTCFWSCE